MRTITINVEFTVEIDDDKADLDLLTFDIPMEMVEPQDENNKRCGRLIGYCTQQNYDVVSS